MWRQGSMIEKLTRTKVHRVREESGLNHLQGMSKEVDLMKNLQESPRKAMSELQDHPKDLLKNMIEGPGQATIIRE